MSRHWHWQTPLDRFYDASVWIVVGFVAGVFAAWTWLL